MVRKDNGETIISLIQNVPHQKSATSGTGPQVRSTPRPVPSEPVHRTQHGRMPGYAHTCDGCAPCIQTDPYCLCTYGGSF